MMLEKVNMKNNNNHEVKKKSNAIYEKL